MSKLTNTDDFYLDLMKRCLIGSIYPGMDGTIWPKTLLSRKLLKMMLPQDVRCYQLMTQEERERGLSWPHQAQTMIGQKRLNNIQYCVENIIKNQVPGDLIETGVWRGGAAIFMRALLKAYDVKDRTVWVADSFEGFPKSDAKKHLADARCNLPRYGEVFAVSLEQVKANFTAYDLLDDQVRFLKGWFKDTLPIAPISKLAVVRLDGDLYESTMDALKCLYPKLSIGGYLIVDDYAITMCKNAVHDFRTAHNITEKIRDIDGVGIFWRRVC